MSVVVNQVNGSIEDYLIERTSAFVQKALAEGKEISPKVIEFFMKQWVLDYKIMN